MKKLTLLMIAVLAVLVMQLSSMGQAQDDDPTPTLDSWESMSTAYNQRQSETQQANARATNGAVTARANAYATNAVLAQNADVDAAATSLHLSSLRTPNPGYEGAGCGGSGYHDAAHKTACDAHRAEYQARYGSPCRLTHDGNYWVCLHDEWTGPLPTSTPSPSGPAELGGPTEPGGPSESGGPAEPGGPTVPGGPAEPGSPTGPVHTVGEGIFDVDAAATALHQMIHSPDATPAFRSICDLPPSSPAEVAACDLYKAAYRLRYGNPCRHNDEGEAVCLH